MKGSYGTALPRSSWFALTVPLGIPTTGSGNHRANGPAADNALTIRPDQSDKAAHDQLCTNKLTGTVRQGCPKAGGFLVNFFNAKLVAVITFSFFTSSSFAADNYAPVFLQAGPEGNINNLPEDEFYVDGTSGNGKVFKFSNGERTLYFIPMIHQAEPEFYAAVANEVKHLKTYNVDLFYEFIDFEAATLTDKLRVRAMLGFLPTPEFYALTVSDGLIAQDNAMFLGFPGGDDINVDATPKEIADAYEAMIGPLEISKENLNTPLDSFVLPTSDVSQISRVTIDWRNERLAKAINEADGDLVVLYGAAHGAGTLRALHALDSRWQRAD